VAGIVGLAGAVLLTYAPVVNLQYARTTTAAKAEFVAATTWSGTGSRPYDALYQYLRSENERLHRTGQSGLVDAFSYETAAVDLSAYGIADNIIGYVTLPTAGIDLPIHLGANQANLSLGAVHLTQTSYPIGGPDTNAVIAAHRGSVVAMFRNIHKIRLGDPVIITNVREQLLYRAVDILIIQPDEVHRVTIQPGRDLVTLLTCDPIGGYYQRYVVVAERVQS